MNVENKQMEEAHLLVDQAGVDALPLVKSPEVASGDAVQTAEDVGSPEALPV